MILLTIGALVVTLIAGAVGLTGFGRRAATVTQAVFGLFLALALLLAAAVSLGVSVIQ
jgi:uncharacterized membrane protein YtjA (UPF0391 family)